jgi:hypothetical protein
VWNKNIVVVAAGHSVDVARWVGAFGEVIDRIAPRCARYEPLRHAASLMQGLLAPLERKNCWTEDTAPAAERQVRGEDQRGVLVAAGHELEEQIRGVLLEGEVADLVDDDQPVASQPDELVGEPATRMALEARQDPVADMLPIKPSWWARGGAGT